MIDMTGFITTVLGVSVGILLTSVIAAIVTLQPRVWRWYTRKVQGLMEQSFEDIDRAIDKAFEAVEKQQAKDL